MICALSCMSCCGERCCAGKAGVFWPRAFVEPICAAAERVPALLVAGCACDANLVAMLRLDASVVLCHLCKARFHVSVMPLRATGVWLWVDACGCMRVLICCHLFAFGLDAERAAFSCRAPPLLCSRPPWFLLCTWPVNATCWVDTTPETCAHLSACL